MNLSDLIKKLTTSWKTSSMGLGMICTALGHMLHDHSVGCPIQFGVDVPVLLGGIGLLAAKDSNVTGGTKSETSPPEQPQPKPLSPLPENATKEKP